MEEISQYPQSSLIQFCKHSDQTQKMGIGATLALFRKLFSSSMIKKIGSVNNINKDTNSLAVLRKNPFKIPSSVSINIPKKIIHILIKTYLFILHCKKITLTTVTDNKQQIVFLRISNPKNIAIGYDKKNKNNIELIYFVK